MDWKFFISIILILLLTFFDLKRSYLNRNSNEVNSTSIKNSHSIDKKNENDLLTSTIQTNTPMIIKFRFCHSSG